MLGILGCSVFWRSFFFRFWMDWVVLFSCVRTVNVLSVLLGSETTVPAVPETGACPVNNQPRHPPRGSAPSRWEAAGPSSTCRRFRSGCTRRSQADEDLPWIGVGRPEQEFVAHRNDFAKAFRPALAKRPSPSPAFRPGSENDPADPYAEPVDEKRLRELKVAIAAAQASPTRSYEV